MRISRALFVSLALASLATAATADIPPGPHRRPTPVIPPGPEVKVTGTAAKEIARLVQNGPNTFTAKCEKEEDSSNYTCVLRQGYGN
jgi:hypothetical protein